MKFITHLVLPGQTLYAVVKLYNGHDISAQDLHELMLKYNELNGEEVPRAGQIVMIPLNEKAQQT